MDIFQGFYFLSSLLTSNFHIVSDFMNRQASKESVKTTFIGLYVGIDDD